MKYPIITYGDPVLRQKAVSIGPEEYPNIKELIGDMFETMHAAQGIGLAAPQIGMPIRLFVVDCSAASDRVPELQDFKKAFINAVILDEEGEEWAFREGCLSIPGIMEDVYRKPTVKLSYYDEDWNPHEEIFEGLAARVIQHEYDHIEGKLFIDKLRLPLDPLVEKRLDDITNGIIDVNFPDIDKTTKNSYWLFGSHHYVITDPDNGDYDQVEKRSKRGVKTPPHIHGGYSELVYVIEGEMTVHTKEQSFTLKPGQHFFVPKGMPHFLEATQAEGITRTLQTFAPGGFGKLLVQFGTASPEDVPPVETFDMELFEKLSGEIGDVTLAPPGSGF